MKSALNISSKCIKRIYSEEKGQAMILVALAMAVLLGFGALTTDVGYLYVQRRQAQNTADAAALAGTWAIQDGQTKVEEIVDQYAQEHGISPGEITSEIVNNGTAVRVDISKTHDLFLARIININSSVVGATATATRSSIWSSSHRDLLPIGLTRYLDYFYDEVEVEEEDEESSNNGNSGNNSNNGNSGNNSNNGNSGNNSNNGNSGNNGGGNVATEYVLKPDLASYLMTAFGDEYTTIEELEEALINNRAVYKKALEFYIGKTYNQFDLAVDDSSYGNFGFLDLDGNPGGGASITGAWIDNGYNGILDNIISENGNMSTLDSNLQSYINTRGQEGYIIGILPAAIKRQPNNWNAASNEYVIIHVKNLELSGQGGHTILSGSIEEIMYPGDVLLPGSTTTANLPQSWIID